MRCVVAILFSLLFHLVLFFAFFYFQSDRHRLGRWSGGRGETRTAVVYVDLGTFPVMGPFAAEATGDRPGSRGPSLLKRPGASPPQEAVKVKALQSKKNGRDLKAKKVNSNQGHSKTGGQIKNSGVGTSDTPAGGVGPGLDPDGVISQIAPGVLAAIRKKILKNKVYPAIARENRWTGVVRLRFKIDESGNLESVRVRKGSGHDALDDAAVQTVKAAVPLPYYPDEIALSLEYQLE